MLLVVHNAGVQTSKIGLHRLRSRADTMTLVYTTKLAAPGHCLALTRSRISYSNLSQRQAAFKFLLLRKQAECPVTACSYGPSRSGT